MSQPPKAIFLSYASQDAEAARRLCETLRAAGVEVWFDVEGGLETGDEWDAKIRRQIKECVLFLPVISENTQAREEGYFRIEWDLAAERARGIASGVPFILPIVIDDTRQPDALVPDRFRSVQWTKAPAGELSSDGAAKLAKLWSHRAGLARHKQALADPQRALDAVAPRSARQTPWGAVGIAGGVLAAGLVAFFVWRSRPAPLPPSAPGATVSEVSAAASYPRDPELRRARQLLFTTDAIPDDFVLAEDILKPLVAQRPNDPEVAAVAAEVALEFLIRGFDLTPARRTQVQRLTERAAQLAPDNPYAVAAVGRYLLFIDAQLARAEELTRRAIALQPDEARFHRTLFSILARTKPPAEVDAFAERMAAQFPRDALVSYDIARRYKDENDLVQAEKWFDRTLAHDSPPAFAMVWKSWFMLQVHGDLAASKEWLDRVPERQRANARVANARYVQALYSGDTAHALRALNEVADDWLTDFDFTGPKALLLGNLYLRSGRNDLAKLQLESALALTNAEIEKNPTDLYPRRAKMWVLISLGRLDEARAIYPMLLQATRRPYVLNFRNLSWTNNVVSALLLGYRDDALALLGEAASDPNSRLVLRNFLQQDPRLAAWRNDPAIAALVAEPDAPKVVAAPAVDEKSVAVLAFSNLSEDKSNEYFSDGVSEELLNVLAKVPGLKVSARTSAFSFKGRNVPVAEIARQLGVAYVVEGSVRKAGDKVRVSAQLIKAADGFQVWSDTFTRDFKDAFAVQDEIAALVAQNLRVTLGQVQSAPRAAINPEAFELYVQARQAWNLRTSEGFERAERLLKRALELEPNFARGHAALSDVWATRDLESRKVGRFRDRNSPQMQRILDMAARAVALDPQSAEAHASLGNAYLNAWRLDDALRTLRHAVTLNPNYASGHQFLGRAYLTLGYYDEAVASLARAAELDPLSHRIVDNYAIVLRASGRLPEALAMAQRALAIKPDAQQAATWLAVCLSNLGRHEEAVAQARRLSSDGSQLEAYLVGVYAAAGLKAEAEAALARVAQVAPEWRFIGLLALGRPQEALAALDPLELSSNNFFQVDLSPIRDDPRFVQLLATVGLTEAEARIHAWRKAHPPKKGTSQ